MSNQTVAPKMKLTERDTSRGSSPLKATVAVDWMLLSSQCSVCKSRKPESLARKAQQLPRDVGLGFLKPRFGGCLQG